MENPVTICANVRSCPLPEQTPTSDCENQNINDHPQLVNNLQDYLSAISNDGHVPSEDTLAAIAALAPSDGEAISLLEELAQELQDLGIVLAISSDGGASSASIVVDEGEIAVTTVTAVDPQNDPITYEIIGGEDADLFQIDTNTDELTFIAAQNFEAPSDAGSDGTYTITVRAVDTVSGQTDDQMISVLISDVNEAPTFNDSFIFVDEDDTAETIDLTALADDEDIGDDPAILQYTIIGGNGPLASATISEGIFSFAPGNDFQQLAQGDTATFDYQLQVADTKEQTATATLSVTVVGANDAPVTDGDVSVTVSEDAAAFSIDLVQGVSDIDDGDTLTVQAISLLGGSGAGITLDGDALRVNPDAYKALGVDQTEVISIDVVIADQLGATVSRNVEVVVTGASDAVFIDSYELLLSWDRSGFDANRVTNPSIVANEDGSIDMFYGGLGFANIIDMGYARSIDGTTFSKLSQSPVIDASQDNPAWASWLANPESAFKIDGEFVVYFNGDNSNLITDFNHQGGWGRATSSDGFNWDVQDDPIRLDVGRSEYALLKEVVEVDGDYFAFCDLSPNRVVENVVSFSSDGINFTNDQIVDFGGNVLESAVGHDGEILGIFRGQDQNNGTLEYLLGRSLDGIVFEFSDTLTTSKPLAIKELVVQDDGTVDVYTQANQGNINWNFGNIVIERFSIDLDTFGPALTAVDEFIF